MEIKQPLEIPAAFFFSPTGATQKYPMKNESLKVSGQEEERQAHRTPAGGRPRFLSRRPGLQSSLPRGGGPWAREPSSLGRTEARATPQFPICKWGSHTHLEGVLGGTQEARVNVFIRSFIHSFVPYKGSAGHWAGDSRWHSRQNRPVPTLTKPIKCLHRGQL